MSTKARQPNRDHVIVQHVATLRVILILLSLFHSSCVVETALLNIYTFVNLVSRYVLPVLSMIFDSDLQSIKEHYSQTYKTTNKTRTEATVGREALLA